MSYKTDVQRRMAEVLDALHIKAAYYEKDGFFVIEKGKFFIYEEEPDLASGRISGALADCGIKICGDGTLVFRDGQAVFINYCRNCRQFYFDRPHDGNPDSCPECGGNSVKHFLNRSRIPGWFGKEEECLIDKREIGVHLKGFYSSEKKDDVVACISRLTGKVSYVTVDSSKRDAVMGLGKKYPNMTEVIDYMLKNFEASCMRKHREIAFRPMVLVGNPGCGKTSFVSELCRILLGRHAIKIDLGNDVPVFAIAGSDPGYKDSSHGLIIASMFGNDERGPLKNPLIHFDELDKIHTNERYSIETVFYSILEKNTARRFYDNFIGMNVDASGVNYIFTANTLEKIPKPIVNRLKVFLIPDYTHEQLKGCVIDNFYRNWLCNNGMEQEYLPEILSDEIKELILRKCNDDPRSIEDAINLVFSETLADDEKTGHKIALFSPEQYFLGWENFRGKKYISRNAWKLQDGFLNSGFPDEDENDFDDM